MKTFKLFFIFFGLINCFAVIGVQLIFRFYFLNLLKIKNVVSNRNVFVFPKLAEANFTYGFSYFQKYEEQLYYYKSFPIAFLPAKYIGPDDHDTAEILDDLTTFNYSLHVIILKEVFVSADSVIVDEEGFHGLSLDGHNWDIIKFNFQNFIVPIFDSIISIGHEHTYLYGHWIIEILPNLILLPKEIIQQSIIILPNNFQFFDHLSLIGVPKNNIIINSYLIYAKKCYCVKEIYTHHYNQGKILYLRRYLLKIFNITNEIPKKFVFVSRRDGETKVVNNLNDLFHQCKENWPEHDWSYIYVSHNLSESVQTFYQTRFCYSIHCSGIMNSVFMQSNTIMFELRTKEPYPNLIQLSKLTGKRHFLVDEKSIQHFNLGINEINISCHLDSIKNAFIQSEIIIH